MSHLYTPLTFALLAIACLSSASATEHIQAQFENNLQLESTGPLTLSAHGGHVGPYAAPASGDAPVIPTAADTGIRFVQSSSYQLHGNTIPYPAFIEDAIQTVTASLYPHPSLTTINAIAGSSALFRYKPLLYSASGSGVAAQVDDFTEWYGPSERAAFADAIEPLRRALAYAPSNNALRRLLLDAYYDRAAAEIQLIKQKVFELGEIRLGIKALPQGLPFIIDREIQLQEEIIAHYQLAQEGYSALLQDRMGIHVPSIDSEETTAIPFGQYLFREAQPSRNQMAASYVNENNNVVPVPQFNPDTMTTEPGTERVLFQGYKDYVFLLGLLSDQASRAAQLVRSYGMRSGSADIPKGYVLVSKTQQDVSFANRVLAAMFPDYTPPANDASGLRAAQLGIQVSLAEVDQARVFLGGQVNPLGFDPNFLVMFRGLNDASFDTYDALKTWLTSNTLQTPLRFAEQAYNTAVANYDQYKRFSDQVHQQVSNLEASHSDRYFEITGYNPSDTSTNHVMTPAQGSELWEVSENIELANERVGQIDELEDQIQDELELAESLNTTASNKPREIRQALATYQTTARSQWQEVANWSAATASAQATYEAVSDIANVDAGSTILSGGATVAAIGAAGIANEVIQGLGAGKIAIAEGNIDLASASFEAELAQADALLAVQEARRDLEVVRREQIGIALESAEAVSLRSQEIARRASLLRELERLDQQLEANSLAAHDRYYADPTHFLRARNDVVLADNAFREAQEWIFFLVRALEYKWNKEFIHTFAGKDWEVSSLFKLRNFSELDQFVAAMEAFNGLQIVSGNFNPEFSTDKISLRDDVFARFHGNGVDDGMRIDAATGDLISKEELFRRQLPRTADGEGNYVIGLDTFSLDLKDSFLFLGPTYNSDGSVNAAGKYLDKIDWLKFRVVDSSVPSSTTVSKSGNLSYGGVSYIRNRVPPEWDANDPFRLSGEFRQFPFYFYVTFDNGANWQTRKSQEDTVKIYFHQQPGEPGTLPGDPSDPNDTLNTFLKERSVASTDWSLTISDSDINLATTQDIEIYLRHRYVSRVKP